MELADLVVVNKADHRYITSQNARLYIYGQTETSSQLPGDWLLTTPVLSNSSVLAGGANCGDPE